MSGREMPWPRAMTRAPYDVGSATFGLKDADFAAHLTKAMPAGISFDPNA